MNDHDDERELTPYEREQDVKEAYGDFLRGESDGPGCPLSAMRPAERPTPITDAVFGPNVTGERSRTCRDLERQLAQAQEEIANLKWKMDIDRKVDAGLAMYRGGLLAKIDRQAERIRYLEGATNHATGTPLSKAREQRDRLVDFVDSLVNINGPYFYLNGTSVVSDAYRVLAAVKEQA